MSEPRFAAIAQDLLALAGRERAQYGGNILPLLGTSGGEKWRGGMSSSGLGTMVNHATARQNARVAMQESVQARAVVERTADSVADGGLRLELSPVIEILGVTREYATQWARDVEARHHLWAKDKKQHRSGTMNFYQSQGLWQLFRHRDNDQFVRLFYENDAELQNPLQFDFVDPDQVRGNAYTSTLGSYGQGGYTSSYGFQSTAVDGIIRDERGREQTFKVWVKQADGSFKDIDIPARFPGGRISMLHGFSSEYAGQGRGYSRMAHAVQDLEKITDFSAGVIQKAINQSSIVAFVKPSKDEDATNPIAEIMDDFGAGPAAQYLGSDPQSVDGLPAPDAQPLERFYRVPEATMRTPGGLFIGNLRKGSDISFPQNNSPGDTYDKFVDAFTSHIAASLKIPLEVVLMKFGQNYSASRATLLLFYRVVCMEREEMASDYLWPTTEMWLCGEIAAGRVVAPGWSDPRMRAAWLNGTWIGSGPPDIDPAKSARAARDNMEIGRTNAERESRDFNGTSAADNVAKNNAAFANYKPLPWNEPGNPPPGAPAAPAAPTPAPKGGANNMAWLLDEMRTMIREELEDAAT